MSVQITIIGLGQIGSSVGLALADREEPLVRVGHDVHPEINQRAKQIGAVDKVSRNLFQAIRGADLVLLALPLDQIEETLSLIGEELKENAVVMDTAPVKAVVARWAGEHLPAGRHYVGLAPLLNAKYLGAFETGIDSARADLFKDGLVAIVSSEKSDPAAIQLAVDLTRLLAASPLFIDAAEVDGFMASTFTLPQLLAAALLDSTVDRPGWQDGCKFTGRAYASMTAPITFADSPGALASACLQNQENITRVIDHLVEGLQQLRAAIANQEVDRLQEQLFRVYEARLQWWAARQAAEGGQEGDTQLELPSTSQMLSRLFFGERKRPRRGD